MTGELPLSFICLIAPMRAENTRSVGLGGNTGFTLPQNMGELGDDITKLDLSSCSLAGNVIVVLAVLSNVINC
jgi:hypothetical protein